MAVIKFGVFRGEVPRLSPEALPEGASPYALNVDLAHGELRGLREDAPVTPSIAVAVRSLYTENGEDFFGWPWPVNAVRGQIVDDVHYRIYFTASQYFPGSFYPTGNWIKVARTKRLNADGTVTNVINSERYNVNPKIPNYYPPETSNIGQSGNGLGPDCWALGVPAPRVQADIPEDNLGAVLDPKPSWPNIPQLKLRVTFYLEDQGGNTIRQMDISGDQDTPGLPQIIISEPQPGETAQEARGNKIQDMLWALGGTQARKPAPFQKYWFSPPALDSDLYKTVAVVKNDAASGDIKFDYSSESEPFDSAVDQSGIAGQAMY